MRTASDLQFSRSQFSILNSLVEPLSERELEVLRLIAEGHSNQAIADRLVVAVSTVKKHVNNIYGKLDVQSRTQALLARVSCTCCSAPTLAVPLALPGTDTKSYPNRVAVSVAPYPLALHPHTLISATDTTPP